MIEGNKMKRKLIGLLGVALSCLALTTGCSSSNSDSKAASDPHYSAMVENLVKPQDHAIDWKITTMYIKLADLESVEIDENMEAYI